MGCFECRPTTIVVREREHGPSLHRITTVGADSRLGWRVGGPGLIVLQGRPWRQPAFIESATTQLDVCGMQRPFVALLTIASVLIASTAIRVESQAPPPQGRPAIGFVVIGPTADLRGWTSEWVTARLQRSSAVRDTLAAWRNVLYWLDTAAPAEPGPPPPDLVGRRGSGPSAEYASRRYPWDLEVPMRASEMRAVLHISRMASMAQIIVEVTNGSYRVTALVISRADSTVITHVSRDGPSLRQSSSTVGDELRWIWERALLPRTR